MLTTLFLLIQLGFAILIFFLALAFITGAPFVPSTRQTAKTMIDLAHIKPGMIVYDLGSGDGRLLFLAAQKGATAFGIEINPFLVLLTWVKKTLSPYNRNIHVRWQNFWQADFSRADAVFVYLLPWKMDKLAKKLTGELKSGSVVISNNFIFPKWKVLRQDPQNHVYVFPR